MKATIWNGVVDGPGIYLGVPMDDYRADPCPAPSLNSSVARVALEKSLEHAKAKHPRLAEIVEEDEDDPKAPTRAMDIGSAAHSLAFGVGASIALIHAENWKKKAAQEARDAAREAGEIPLLPKEYRRAKAMAAKAGPIITDLLEGSVVAEAMLVWQERGLWRRGLIDRMRPDARVIIDYKTTERDLTPETAKGLVYAAGHDFQEGFYRRGLDVLDPEGMGRRRFCFLYQEQKPPFALVLVEIDEAGQTVAEQQVEAACNLWDRAISTDRWPGFPLGPHIATPKPWDLTRWQVRSDTDATLIRYAHDGHMELS